MGIVVTAFSSAFLNSHFRPRSSSKVGLFSTTADARYGSQLNKLVSLHDLQHIHAPALACRYYTRPDHRERFRRVLASHLGLAGAAAGSRELFELFDEAVG